MSDEKSVTSLAQSSECMQGTIEWGAPVLDVSSVCLWIVLQQKFELLCSSRCHYDIKGTL